MSAFASRARTVQLIERNDRERQLLQQSLEALGLHVEAFNSLVERTTERRRLGSRSRPSPTAPAGPGAGGRKRSPVLQKPNENEP